MRRLIFGLAMLAVLTVVSSACADAPNAQFRAYLASRFGVRAPRWAICPRVAEFNGLRPCEAQFRQGSRWRFVSTAIRTSGTFMTPFTRTWVRRWRTCPRRHVSYVPGTLRSNTGTCDYLMAGDVQYEVDTRLRFPRRVGVHGTNTAGFGARVDYRCIRQNRTARCTNSLGDSFRYTAPAGLLPPAATHWCRGGDPPIHASRRTSCPFAGNVVTRVFNGPVLGQGRTRTISVHSPVTRRSYRLRLVRRLDYVTANGPNGIWLRFFYEF